MAERNALGSKGRVLFLRKYLEEHTDDDHKYAPLLYFLIDACKNDKIQA